MSGVLLLGMVGGLGRGSCMGHLVVRYIIKIRNAEKTTCLN